MMLPPRMIMTNPMFVTVSSNQTAYSASSLVLPAQCTQGFIHYSKNILLLSDLHVCHLLLMLLVFLHEGNKIKFLARLHFPLTFNKSSLIFSFSFSGFSAFCLLFPHVSFTLYFFLCFR